MDRSRSRHRFAVSPKSAHDSTPQASQPPAVNAGAEPEVAAPSAATLYRRACRYAAAHANADLQRDQGRGLAREEAVRRILDAEDWSRFGGKAPELQDVLALMAHPATAAAGMATHADRADATDVAVEEPHFIPRVRQAARRARAAMGLANSHPEGIAGILLPPTLAGESDGNSFLDHSALVSFVDTAQESCFKDGIIEPSRKVVMAAMLREIYGDECDLPEWLASDKALVVRAVVGYTEIVTFEVGLKAADGRRAVKASLCRQNGRFYFLLPDPEPLLCSEP